MVKQKKERQQTLEATLGRPRVRPPVKTAKAKGPLKGALGGPASSSPARNVKSSPRAPPSSFVHSSQVFGSARKKRAVLDESSSEEGEESDGVDVVELPMVGARRGKKVGASPAEGGRKGQDDGRFSDEDDDDEDDDEDDDDKPPVAPTPRRKRRMVADDSDDDDEPLVSSPVKRRRLVRGNTASSPVKKGQGGTDDDGDEAAPAAPRAGRTRRKPLTQKEKARELLRRKRAGEIVNEEEELSSSEDEAPAKAMYDTDSDHPALEEFEDDEEGVLDFKRGKKGKEQKSRKKKKKKKGKAAEGGDSDASMDDFVVDDSDAPLGAPDDVFSNIPLEFTSHSHKPLKEHFRDAIEWLVQLKVNPGFADKENPLYRMAWKKLDDEVRGLATSKFASAAWKKDFFMTLRARPYIVSEELPKGGLLDLQSCGACGRSGHPAKHMITFTGTPYYKDTTKLSRFLLPVELDSDSGSEPQDDDEEDEDEDGNAIPKQTKQWLVGSVCNSNAETAHSLMHWKHELLDWVDTRLHQEGYMTPDRLAERERMRPKQKYKLVDAILEKWVNGRVVRDLYHAFKGTIETARNKPTTGRYR